MTALITRLEQATEGSEEIDVAIGREWYGYGPEDPLWHMMPFSRSLDAALTLVPEGLCWRYDSALGYAEIFDIGTSPMQVWASSDDPTLAGHTPALALCIAALRARG